MTYHSGWLGLDNSQLDQVYAHYAKNDADNLNMYELSQLLYDWINDSIVFGEDPQITKLKEEILSRMNGLKTRAASVIQSV